MDKAKYLFSSEDLPSSLLDGVQVVRDPDGVWRYAKTWIPVPGARDVTLTERFDPKLIVSADGDIERVVVDGASIKAHPELLEWCVIDGTPIREDDEIVEALVPYELWLKHDRISSEPFSPEHEGTEPERALAAAERRYREAEQQFELTSAERAEVLHRYSEDMTRQQAREITGLSIGRIQQLIRSERLEPYERQVLELFEAGPVPSLKDLQKLAKGNKMPSSKNALKPVVDDLKERSLLTTTKGGNVSLSSEGFRALLEGRALGHVLEAGED